MAKFRNESMGVVNVGGVFIAPKKVGEIDEKTPGADRMIKRGVLVKVDGRTAGAKAEKPAEKGGDTKPAE